MKAKFWWGLVLVAGVISGCRPSKPPPGNQLPPVVPEVPKSFQTAFENEPPYGLDFEEGFAVRGETLAYGDTPAGLDEDMATGNFIQARPGKGALLYLRHEDPPEGGVGLHVLALQVPELAAGKDSLPAKTFKGVLYVFHNTRDGDFFQARRGEGTVTLDTVGADSVKGTLALSLLGKRAKARVREAQPAEHRLALSGRFVLPVKTPKEVAQLQKARQGRTPYERPF
jgi:hypothetical protein